MRNALHSVARPGRRGVSAITQLQLLQVIQDLLLLDRLNLDVMLIRIGEASLA